MGTPSPVTSRLLPAAAVAAVAALFWRMAVEPVDFGYVRYLGIADEMARSGDWVVMRLVDHIYLDKPPFFFWLMAPLIALLGEAPGWVAHVPDLLALALSLLCIHRLGAAIYGKGEPALAGVLVFATTWEAFSQATGKRLDPVFAALLTAALTAFYLGASRKERPRQALLGLAWLAVALATLTKGPLAILLFLLVATGWAAWTRRLHVFVSRGSLAGLALFLVLLSLWPALLAARLGTEEALRALAETDLATRTGGLLLYSRSLLVMQLPWSLFLPALGFWLWRRRPWQASDGLRFALVWFVAIFAVLHLSEAKHQRYLLPASPGLSLLLVGLWYAPSGGRAEAGPARLTVWATGILLAALALAGSLAGAAMLLLDVEPVSGFALPPERWLAAPVALATGGGAVLALASLARGGAARRSPLPLAALLLGVLTAISLLGAGQLRQHDPIPLARTALAPVAEGRPTALLGLYEEQHQMSRLLTRRAIPVLENAAAVAQWARVQGEAGALVLTQESGRRALALEPGLEVRILRDFDLAQEPLVLLELRPGA